MSTNDCPRWTSCRLVADCRWARIRQTRHRGTLQFEGAKTSQQMLAALNAWDTNGCQFGQAAWVAVGVCSARARTGVCPARALTQHRQWQFGPELSPARRSVSDALLSAAPAHVAARWPTRFRASRRSSRPHPVHEPAARYGLVLQRRHAWSVVDDAGPAASVVSGSEHVDSRIRYASAALDGVGHQVSDHRAALDLIPPHEEVISLLSGVVDLPRSTGQTAPVVTPAQEGR